MEHQIWDYLADTESSEYFNPWIPTGTDTPINLLIHWTGVTHILILDYYN